MKFCSSAPGKGHVEIDEEGNIWWISSSGEIQLLTESGSLCGIANIWETSHDDCFRDACAWHDGAYRDDSYVKRMGWSRKRVDRHFLYLMLSIAKNDAELCSKAYRYYTIVRCFGWLRFYEQEEKDVFLRRVYRDSK